MRVPQHLTALVTGASSGIGEAIAKALALMGNDLILVSENQPELERVRGEIAAAQAVQVRTIVADLSLPGAGRHLYDACKRQGLEVGILINCAGIFLNVERELEEPEAVERLTTLHVQTPAELCLLFGKGMIERRRGYILNTGSISALFPDPSSLTYGASKRFLLAFSAALHLQWREHNVKVCCLLPGGTRTGFFASNRIYVPPLVAKNLYPPERIAGRGLQALFHGRRSVIPGLRAKLQVLLFSLILTGPLFGFSVRLYFRLRNRHQAAPYSPAGST